MTFFVSHWELSLLCVISFIWIVLTEMNEQKANIWSIQPSAAIDLINKQAAIVFDLRNQTIFEQGHIVGAKRTDFNLSSDDPKASLKINLQSTCIFVCATGQASSKIATALRSKGYTQVYALNGGMPTWQKESLPMVKGK